MVSIPQALSAAALLAATTVMPVHANDLPKGVGAVVDGYAQQCRELGGSMSEAAAKPSIMTADFDGDGEQDYLLNPQNLQCEGSATAFCGNGGCEISLLLSGGGFEKPLSALGGEPTIRQREDGTVLEVWVDGSNCDPESREQACWQVFSWGEGEPQQTYEARPLSD